MKSSRWVFLVTSSLAGSVAPAFAGCSGDDSSSPDRDAGVDTNTPAISRVDSGPGTAYHAELNGYQQTPPVATLATGKADLVLRADKRTLEYHVQHNVANARLAHIHLGAAMESGGIVYSLQPVSNDMKGIVPLASPDDLANLDGAKWYINIHSPANPDGEIRGQILHPNETLYVATLTGGQETPPSGSPATGTAAVVLDADRQNIVYHVKSSVTPTKAHIHTAIATKASDPTIEFAATTSVIDGTAPVTPAQATDLAEGRLYVNIHTAAKPAGEIRGQLLLPGEILYSASMNGAQETPPVTTNATGGAQFILAPDAKSLRYEAAFTGLVATVAHIHMGTAGASGAPVHDLAVLDGGAGAKGTISGSDFTPADVAALNANPSRYYINAHTSANPNGEIRGQIQKP